VSTIGVRGARPPAIARRRSRLGRPSAGRVLLALPITAYLAVLALVPLGILLLYSFYTDGFYVIVHSFTLANYKGLVSGDSGQVFRTVLVRTYLLALAVTAVALGLGFPTAYYISRHVHRYRSLVFLLLFVPLSTSYLVKVYAWRSVLGDKGLINYFLTSAGLLNHPLGFLLFNRFAVAVALVSAVLPFMVLPIYSSLERIPGNLLEAASDLGADTKFAFWRVVMPLTRRGIVAGCTFVFIMSFGDFIASQLLGGASGILIGKVIFSSFGLADNWPGGAAMAFAVLLLAGVTLAGLNWVVAGGRRGHDVAVDSQLAQ
jgi:spermidine/putrescine transport system permease protein